ncbi:hypothetical protein [Thermovibrio sp.]
MRNIIFGNLHLKLLALVFALLFWFLASNKETAETEITLKVKPVLSGNYRIVDYKPKKLTFLVEGYRNQLLKLRELSCVYFKLPSSLRERNGWVVVPLKKEYFFLLPQVKVKKVYPDRISVKLERLVKKVAKVEPRLVNLPKGVKVKVFPNYAVVSLPEELEDVPLRVKTEVVDLKGITLPAQIVVSLESPYPVEPKEVKITLKREEKR